jgi:glycosyltransferase involved in cell wall biosynthesis
MIDRKTFDSSSPVITIVTVVYNGAKHLDKTIRSVLNQTYENVEYIIMDGGSTDGTVDIIKKYEGQLSYWNSSPDKGIYDAMNKAIDIATGEWINFMNCGDQFASPEVLKLFAKSYDADILYGDAIIQYANFETTFKKYPLNTMWKHSPFCHQACFIRTSLMKEYKYNLNYKIGADHDIFYRAYIEGKRFQEIPETICYFDGTEGTTKKRIITAIRDKRDIALKYQFSISKWFYYQFFLAYIYINITAKRILGDKLTRSLTKFMKR